MPRPRGWAHSWRRDLAMGVLGVAAGAVLTAIGIAAWTLATHLL